MSWAPYWMRLSWFLTIAASWPALRAARLPRPFSVDPARMRLDYRLAGHSTALGSLGELQIVVPDPVDKRVEDSQDRHQHPQADGRQDIASEICEQVWQVRPSGEPADSEKAHGSEDNRSEHP